MDTVFSGNASAVWHGIVHGLELVKKGMIWRVGNGITIRTWRDPWVPRGPSLRPITPKGRCRLNRMADFLSPSGVWNVELLNRFFWPADVQVICSIRTSPSQGSEFIAWFPGRFVLFSVKSAYQLAMQDHLRAHVPGACSTRPNGERSSWNLI